MSLGQRLSTLLTERGLTQAEVARSLDIDQQALSALIKRQSKRSEFAPALASFFGVRLEWLTTGAEPRNAAEPSSSPLPPDLARRLAGLDDTRRAAVLRVLQATLDAAEGASSTPTADLLQGRRAQFETSDVVPEAAAKK